MAISEVDQSLEEELSDRLASEEDHMDDELLAIGEHVPLGEELQ